MSIMPLRLGFIPRSRRFEAAEGSPGRMLALSEWQLRRPDTIHASSTEIERWPQQERMQIMDRIRNSIDEVGGEATPDSETLGGLVIEIVWEGPLPSLPRMGG